MAIEKKEITLESELEQLIQWKRDTVLCPTPARGLNPDDALYLFNIGLLCGLKEANRNRAVEVTCGDEPIRITEEDLRRAELAQKRERRREGNADARMRPVDECPIGEALKDPGAPLGQRGFL